MASADLHVVILAAGKGTRMKSALPKVLHRAGGLPLIEWVVRLARSLGPRSITAVLGHGADDVRAQFAGVDDVRFVRQEPQLGTGHALLQTKTLLSGQSGRVLLLSGDVPLLTRTSVVELLDAQAATDAAVVVATARVADPSGYGRIVREGGRLARIVEHRDARDEQRAIDEINSGVYVFALAPLFAALGRVGSANAQGEYYLPDLVGIYRGDGLAVDAVVVADPDEIRGINTKAELAEVGRLLQARINHLLMADGVTLVDPATAYIGPDVVIGHDSVIHPFVCLDGATSFGANCEVHAGVRVVDCVIGDNVKILNHSVLTNSRIGSGADIGPFARLRPDSVVGDRVHIGNFVEIKKSELGADTKIGHLSYIGDAVVGAGVNIGAGTITCNYDGHTKHQTVIRDGAFVGSDSTLVAPVTVGADAYVAAGSSITMDVPDGGLGIARSRQTNIPGWVAQRNAKRQSR
ncbi:MAG: bifunctional UDP-N-acetylglucosamine diphosphorylase/glucosamine-1-phosphate N-acetyltransferase GlmU [Acidobacteriota bacterium]